MPGLQAGTVVAGKYRITGTLGAGAMGVVYRAEQLDAEGRTLREVALKTMQPALSADPSFARRFLRETRIAARLSSPNVVTIYDAGRAEDGSLYFTMELVRGKTLRELIDQHGRLATARACRIVAQICEALGEAQALAEPIVHRDLKPANVFVEDRRGEDRVKVNDFGIAKEIGEETSSLTVSGQSPGTPRYMAPEQWRGEEVDGRTDLYAVGIILYECLTGAAPFSGALETVMFKHLNEPPPRLPGDGPSPLQALLARLLAKRREDRPPDARAVQHELERLAAAASAGAEMPTARIEPATTAAGEAPTQVIAPPAAATAVAPARDAATRVIPAQVTRTLAAAPSTPDEPAVPAARVYRASATKHATIASAVAVLVIAAVGALTWRREPAGEVATRIPTAVPHAPVPTPAAAPASVPAAPLAPPTVPLAATAAPATTGTLAPPRARAPAAPAATIAPAILAAPTAAPPEAGGCDREPPSEAEVTAWVGRYRAALVAKDVAALTVLGVVRDDAAADAWKKRLASRRDLQVDVESLEVRAEGASTSVSFSLAQRWRDPKVASMVYDFDAETHRLGREGCRVVALP